MILLTSEDRQKLELLDKVFNKLSIEEIKELVEKDLVVGELRGDDTPKQQKGIISTMVDTMNSLETDLIMAKANSSILENDIRVIVRGLAKMTSPFQPIGANASTDWSFSNDITNLRSKYGAY